MNIVDKINEKTGKFANNLAEAIADLHGKDLKANSILDVIGDGNNITEAIDNMSGKANSNNIMEAVDQKNGKDIPKSMTVEEAVGDSDQNGSKTDSEPEPEPEEETTDFNSMTKAQLQEYANENGIEGVNQNTQTKEEMIKIIEEFLNEDNVLSE